VWAIKFKLVALFSGPHSNSCGAVTTNISYPVTPKCLSCMCEAMSSCDTNGSCTGNVCGLFKITWGYWVEGGKHTVNNESSESAFAHTHCTVDTYCSLLTVQGYMQNFQQVRVVPDFDCFFKREF
jgi:hypothetical protein